MWKETGLFPEFAGGAGIRYSETPRLTQGPRSQRLAWPPAGPPLPSQMFHFSHLPLENVLLSPTSLWVHSIHSSLHLFYFIKAISLLRALCLSPCQIPSLNSAPFPFEEPCTSKELVPTPRLWGWNMWPKLSQSHNPNLLCAGVGSCGLDWSNQNGSWDSSWEWGTEGPQGL